MTASKYPEKDLLCSVIVPVLNGAPTIARCLDALEQQSIPRGRYEIIVVNDGSTDETGARVQEWRARHPDHQFTLIEQPNGGAASARNRGANIAQAPLLLFTDADCAPAPHWMAALLAAFEDPEVMGAKGTYLTEQPELVARFVQVEYEDRYDRMAGQTQIDFIDTYSAAYRRAIFMENGGFDTFFAFNEDQEFSFRLAQKGYRLLFVSRAQVAHLHNRTIGAYWRRKHHTGHWKALITRLYPQRMVHDSHTPQVLKLQIMLVAASCGLLPLACLGIVWSPLQWLWWGIGALLVGFLLTCGPFVLKLARRGWPLALAGPGILLVRALALGSGFLLGTIHFASGSHGKQPPLISGWKRLIKRAIDVVGALMGLIFAIPLVALAAIAIKLDSPGPIFYWQQRIGENGHPFRMVKLRSMVYNAEEQLATLIDLDQLPEPVYKLPDDPRITRVGRILRRTSLDETPQFYNVLLGQMSLVGPRPEESSIVARYEDQQRRRLTVKPGMTGPMQISGRGDLSLAERLRLELDYIDNYSIWRDFVIMVRTVPVILNGSGAY